MFRFLKTLLFKAILRMSRVLCTITLSLRLPRETAVNIAWELLLLGYCCFVSYKQTIYIKYFSSA